VEEYLIYIIPAVSVILVSVILYYILKKRSNKNLNSLDHIGILDLIDKSNVISIDYIRNKIVINFQDVSQFNVEKLHSLGVKGISVVGDKIKFYVSDDSKINKKLYESIEAFIEGK
jgi:phosphotransferase system IIB component